MKRIIWGALVVSLVVSAGCEKLRKKTEVSERKVYDVRYWGYKRAVKVKASPAEVEAYLMNPSHMVKASKSLKFKMSGCEKMAKRGDTVVFSAQSLAVPITIRITLLDLVPGKDAVFICLLNDSTMGFIRYHLRPLPDGTRFDFDFEIEGSNPLLENLIEGLKLDELIIRLEDDTVDNMLVHFDPDFRPEQNPEGGGKGENFDKLYAANEVSVWVNASPEKLRQYLADPAFAEMIKQKYDIDFGMVFSKGISGGVYPVSSNLLGNYEQFDVMLLSYDQDKPILAYLASKLPSRMEIVPRPARGGTQVTLAFMIMPPSAFTMEPTKALSNTSLLPNAVERVLLDIKAAVEGGV